MKYNTQWLNQVRNASILFWHTKPIAMDQNNQIRKKQ